MSFIDEALYKQIHASMPIVGVDIVIVMDNNIVVCKRNNEPAKNEYWLPGGRVHKGESLNQACSRVLRDELGYTAEPENFSWLSVEELLFTADPFSHGSGTHTVTIVFCLFVIPNTKFKIDSQHSKIDLYPKSGVLVGPYVKRLYELITSKQGVAQKHV